MDILQNVQHEKRDEDSRVLDAQKLVDVFFERFASESEMFDSSGLKRLRLNMGWDKEDAQLLSVEIKKGHMPSVYIK